VGQQITLSFSTILEMAVVPFYDYILCVSMFCIFIFQFIINIESNFLHVYNRINNFYFDNSSYHHIHINKYKVGFLNQTLL